MSDLIEAKKIITKRPYSKTFPEVKVIPLGGVEEIGINSTAFEYKDSIIVVDAGLGFPENDQYGIDYLIPNIDYLKRNKKRVRAIFITHGHYDHIGGLQHILPALDYPKLYAPPFAAELIKSKLEEVGILNKVDLRVFTGKDIINSGHFKLEFFRVNHSTPDSYGIAINSPAGTIVHTGDFKFDNSPLGEDPADYGKIARIGSRGVLALLSDSTNAFKAGHSKSEIEVMRMLRDVVEKAQGRIIVATFSQLVVRINQLIKIAMELDRKVSVSGRSLETALKIAKKLDYIDAPEDIFIPLRGIKRFKPNKQMIFTTGHQGETMAALSRIARGEHRDIQIQKGDTVILSSSIIPGNDVLIQRMIDDLSQRGAIVYHQAIMDLHAGGHGFQEDQKLMINLVKPKFFIPVHGYQSFLIQHGRTAQQLGIPEKNVIIAKRGKEIIINKNAWRFGKIYKSKPVIVSGLGVGDVGDSILKEREQLANYGIVILNIKIDKEKRLLLSDPEIITAGFVYPGNNKSLEHGIIAAAKSTTIESLQVNLPFEELQFKVKRSVFKLIKAKIEREPYIITNIV